MSASLPARRMCARCERMTAEPVVIAEIHGNSGPGWTVYACPDCALGYGRRPGRPEKHGGGDALR